MRKYLLPSALILLLGAGFAVGANINKALQLSQDATGSFGVDSQLGVYFPGHVLSPTGGARKNPSVTGTGTPTIAGTDTSGVVTMGTSGVTAVVLFGTAYVTAPACVVSTNVAQTTTPIFVTSVTTSITINQNATSGNLINYWCASAS